MVIDGYSIGGYWCLLMGIILMFISDYSICEYLCLLMTIVVILLTTINEYSIVNISGY
jgi:hypothetical protein